VRRQILYFVPVALFVLAPAYTRAPILSDSRKQHTYVRYREALEACTGGEETARPGERGGAQRRRVSLAIVT